MNDLDARLATLSADKRALFERLLQEKLAQETLPQEAGQPERGWTENVFPISVLQQGIWFLEQLRPNNPAYLIPAAVRIRGHVDTAVLRDAVNEIVRRHESLRTTFQLRDGQPRQVVRSHLTLDLPESDLAGLHEAGLDRPGRDVGDRELGRLVAAEICEPFDLAVGPLLRVRLLRTGTDEYVLAMAMHHLIADGWSVGVLLSELTVLYEAFAAGRPSGLPELAIQYGDFATWQRQEPAGQRRAEDLAYWRSHLAGAPAALALPTDRPRPAVQGFRGASVPVELPEPLLRELGALARRHGATPYMALLAVFVVALHRYSNADDVVVGVPVANRGLSEIEPLIGFFVTMLPVRTELGGDPGFGDVLARVRDACLGAYAHQGVAFEQIVEEVQPPRDLSRTPIFQVSLSYQSDPLPSLAMAGVQLRRLPLVTEGARFDLDLQLFNDHGGVAGWLEYDRDLFDESTIVGMVERLRRLVELVVARPELPMGRLPLVEGTQRDAVLAAGAGSARVWPQAGLVPECIQAQVRSSPTAVAVRYAGAQVSYAELNSRANRLARGLRQMGVGPQAVVGVAMVRSVELMVSLLAVWKAGGAFLPLDPQLPAARLAYLMQDADVPVVLTQRPLAATLPATTGVRVSCVEDLEAVLVGASDVDLPVVVDGEDLAYVIYTSGSTGRPKGVLNVHAALHNRLLWMQDEYGLAASDRVLQKTPLSFDVSVWELFWPLMVGATLVLAAPGGHSDPRYLVDTICSQEVTTVHFVPSMLELFLREPDVGQCTSLRRVLCSGEALTRDLADRFLAACPTQLHNLYGPTEAAIDVTSWACRPDDPPGPVPIGRAIANTQMYVLDRWGQPVGFGVAGELHIGGRNLARGYLHRPDLTADRFVPDPFGTQPGGRLYRTGDLGRIRPDGVVEYLGRLDHQVKIRGQRIELGEIEALLAAHPQVHQALVVTHPYRPDDIRLVAYLTGDPVPAAGQLLAYLRQHLPDYMVPATFVTLPAFPLSPNGKVDRSALPAPEGERPDLHTVYVAPATDTEHTIAAIWRDLLGIDRVGTSDSFFDLGGHSLLATRLRAELSAALGRQVSMVELFQYPTVGALADHLSRSAGPDGHRDGGPDGTAEAGPTLRGTERADGRRQAQDRRQQAAARRVGARTGR